MAFSAWKLFFGPELPLSALVPTQLIGIVPVIAGWQSRISGDETSNPLHNALFGVALALLAMTFLLLEKTSELVAQRATGNKTVGGQYSKMGTQF